MSIVNYSFLPARIPLTFELFFFFPSDFCQGLVKFQGLELFSGRHFFSRLLFNGAVGKLLSSWGCSTACRSDSVSALSFMCWCHTSPVFIQLGRDSFICLSNFSSLGNVFPVPAAHRLDGGPAISQGKVCCRQDAAAQPGWSLERTST